MVLRRIELPGATDVVRFADNKIIMVAIECLEDCPVINTPLAQLSELFPDLPATSSASSADGNLFIPHSADQLFAGDLAYVVTTKRSGAAHARPVRPRGAGGDPHRDCRRRQYRPLRCPHDRAAAEPHQGQDHRDESRPRRSSIADQLRRTVVLHGSALDQKLLLEADIQDADLMVAADQQRPGQHPVERDGQAARLQVQPDAHQQSEPSRT